MNFVEKHKQTIDDAIARLISRAANSRGLNPFDVQPRVNSALEKYVFKTDENATGADVKSFIDALRADDLCLIIACECGDETAWNDLVKNYDSIVKSAARKFEASLEDAEDLASSIWAELHGLKTDGQGNVKTKLAYYSGCGSLAGWLRAVVSRLGIDEYRRTPRFVHIEETQIFENAANDSAENTDNVKVVHASDNPEESLNAKRAQKDVSDALRKAIDALAAEDKLIIKLYYFDKLKLKEIGAAFGYHEATASRRVERIHKELREKTGKILMTEKGWQREEVKRCVAEAALKLDIGLEKMFALLIICALLQEII